MTTPSGRAAVRDGDRVRNVEPGPPRRRSCWRSTSAPAAPRSPCCHGDRAHRRPRLRACRHRPHRRRRGRAVAATRGGRPSPRRARRALAESGVAAGRVVGVGCTSQWSGTVAVDDAGEAIGPAIIWMDSRGAAGRPRDGPGRAQRPGLLGVQAGPLGAQDRRDPQPLGQRPRGAHPLPARAAARRVRATAVFLEPVDYLNLRLTGLARASHDSITVHWVTDNRAIEAIAYDDG